MSKITNEKLALFGGAQLPGLASKSSLATDGAGNIIAGTGGAPATPTKILAGTTFTVAACTQVLYKHPIKIDGVLRTDGILVSV